jgi:hypothetical protein
MEVNRLLRDQGFLRGQPGAYSLTSKGEAFGVQRSHDNGYGGSALRAWETTHFDPSIIDVLDSSPEMLSKVRADINADKQAQKAARKIAQAEADENFLAFQANKESEGAQTRDQPDWRKVLFLAASGLAVSVTTAGVRKGVGWYNRKKA